MKNLLFILVLGYFNSAFAGETGPFAHHYGINSTVLGSIHSNPLHKRIVAMIKKSGKYLPSKLQNLSLKHVYFVDAKSKFCRNRTDGICQMQGSAKTLKFLVDGKYIYMIFLEISTGKSLLPILADELVHVYLGKGCSALGIVSDCLKTELLSRVVSQLVTDSIAKNISYDFQNYEGEKAFYVYVVIMKLEVIRYFSSQNLRDVVIKSFGPSFFSGSKISKQEFYQLWGFVYNGAVPRNMKEKARQLKEVANMRIKSVIFGWLRILGN